MAVLTSTDVYNSLREKLGEVQAKMLTEYMEQKVSSSVDVSKEHLVTKEDLAREIGTVRKEIADSKAEILKWMFAFFTPFYVGMIVFLIKQFL